MTSVCRSYQNPSTEERTDNCPFSVDQQLLVIPILRSPNAKRTQGPVRAPSELHFTVVHTRLAQAEDGHTRFLPLEATPSFGTLYVRHVFVADFYHALYHHSCFVKQSLFPTPIYLSLFLPTFSAAKRVYLGSWHYITFTHSLCIQFSKLKQVCFRRRETGKRNGKSNWDRTF